MSFWGWVGAIAAGWVALSVLFAAGWALARMGGWRGPTIVPSRPLRLVSDERYAEQGEQS